MGVRLSDYQMQLIKSTRRKVAESLGHKYSRRFYKASSYVKGNWKEIHYLPCDNCRQELMVTFDWIEPEIEPCKGFKVFEAEE